MLTSKGYKVLLTNENVARFKKELMVQPFCENPVRFPVFRISEKYLYIPKYYGITQLGAPDIINEQEGEHISFNFIGSLREYQLKTCHQILTHLREKQSGLASIYTGWGKTCAALWIISQLQTKTLIVVHTENLLNQWIERIQQFLQLSNDEIGIIQGPRIDVSEKKIVIGMIQSISMKTYENTVFKDFGFTVFDECFPKNTFIYTNRGILSIYELYCVWRRNMLLCQNSLNVKILSYNSKTNLFEYKSLLYAMEKSVRNITKLHFRKSKICCTNNHKILTVNGYKRAMHLEKGDIILCKYDPELYKKSKNKQDIYPALNSDQLQIVYGLYLQNTNFIRKTKTNSYYIHLEYPIKYLKECQWIAGIFNIYNIVTTPFTCSFTSYFFDIYDFNIDYILENLNICGIAIWFLYDFRQMLNKIEIVNTFSESNNKRMKQILNEYNITFKMENYNDYFLLSINKMNTVRLYNLIQPFLWCGFYKWNSLFCNYGTTVVTRKDSIINNSNYVYDIEVEDNHNFVISNLKRNKYISGIVVSNCHHTPGRIFSRIFYKIGSKYNLGLSATLTRSDGLTKVIKYFLGEVIVNLKLVTIVPKIVFHFTSIEPLEEKKMINNKINLPGMINDLCDSFMRNVEIISIIKKKYAEDRKILVLSDRRNHCIELKRLLSSEYETGLYLGGMKNAALQEANQQRIIFATYSIASEGYDNPTLDTLIFATPKTKIEQAVGRILRQENKNRPEVIDIIDPWSIFNNLYFARLKFYRAKKFIAKKESAIESTIENTEVQLNDCVIVE